MFDMKYKMSDIVFLTSDEIELLHEAVCHKIYRLDQDITSGNFDCDSPTYTWKVEQRSKFATLRTKLEAVLSSRR